MIRLVVMAAGQSTRMGTDKLALAWHGTTVLGYVVHEALTALKESGLKSELVVIARKPPAAYLSPSEHDLFTKNKGKWCLLPAPVPLAQTIKTGLDSIHEDVLGIAFLPGDQIGVNSTVLAGLMKDFVHTEPDALVPVAGTVPGSPVFFHRKLIPELASLSGEQGGKTVLKNYEGKLKRYEVNSDLFTDLDTPEEYNKLTKL